MKSVGNLTDFVRRHMLEPDDTGERIRALIENFENLNQAHEAVVRARDQIDRETLRAQVDEARRAGYGKSSLYVG